MTNVGPTGVGTKNTENRDDIKQDSGWIKKENWFAFLGSQKSS
jgi:hypothetical protein